jgi:hypothetical protein
VAVSGDTIAIGAYGEDGQANDEGAVYLFERNQGTPGAWGLSLRLPSGDPDDKAQFGRALALEDDTLVVGVPNDDFNGTYGLGSAYVFERIAGVWTETQWLSASDGWVYNNFGDSIALDGETLLIGAPGNDHSGITDAGAAYIFERSSGPWTEVRKLTASDPVEDDAFGKVALSGDLALIGAPSNYIAPNLGVGRAYLFARESGGGAWSQVQQLTASDPQNNAQFSRVAIQGNTAAIGAPFQDQGIPIGDVRALAFDSSTQTLYGADSGANQLVSIDLVTGVGTPIGALGFPYVAGMVYHAPSNLLYGVDAPSGDLIRINPTTGKGTVVGPTGFTGLRCLAYDPGPNKLYSFVDQLDLLISISPGTGAGTAVGSLGPLIQGMSFDTATSTLYATDVINDELVTVDTTTAAMTPVGKLGFPNMDGLAFDPIGGTLYGSDRTTGHLFTIDTGSGAATSVGKISTFEYDAGAVYLIALGFETETYCTAGVSASGCQALIEATGVASASASSGFALNISGIEGQKDGLYFYGTNGRQANPWGSGSSYVCVIPPRWRGGLLTGVGTSGSCDGGFSQDLNARWCPTCPKPQHNPGAGALVQAQMWYRDPANTSNQTSSMSDAIEFYVGP